MTGYAVRSSVSRLYIHISATLLNQPQQRFRNITAHEIQEADGRRAVNDAVVKGQAKRNQVARHDLLLVDRRLFHDPPDAEDRTLGQVDNRRKGVNVVHPQVGNRYT